MPDSSDDVGRPDAPETIDGTAHGTTGHDPGTPIVRLRLDGPQITLPRLREFVSVIGDLVQEVAAGVPDVGPGGLRWLLADARAGSFEVALRAEPAKQDVRYTAPFRVIDIMLTGLWDIQRQAERPLFFNDSALEQAKKLVELIGDGITGVAVGTNSGEPIQLTRQLAANVEKLVGPELSAIGTIEGRIETLTIHGRQVFSLYDAVTGRRYECQFGRRVSLEDVTRAFGKRVAIRGIIRQRQGRDALRIEVTSLRVFPAEEDLPSADDVRGILRERPQA